MNVVAVTGTHRRLHEYFGQDVNDHRCERLGGRPQGRNADIFANSRGPSHRWYIRVGGALSYLPTGIYQIFDMNFRTFRYYISSLSCL